MRQHLFRINGTWYFRYVLPEKLIKALAVHQFRELRLSLYTTSHVYARELANAYWLACRELIHSDLQALGIVTVDDFKSHVRRSVMSHLPQKFTPLIELTGSLDADTLVPAIKVLRDTFNAPFFVLPPPTVKGTLYKKVNGDWEPIINAIGQQLPYMRLPNHVVRDVRTAEQKSIVPDHLFNTVKGEEQMFKLGEQWAVWLHQLFIPSDLRDAQLAYMIVRKLSDRPNIFMPPALAAAEAAAIVAARTQQQPKAEQIRASTLLSEEIKTYLLHNKKNWTEKSHDEYKMQLSVFVEMVGDKEILQLTDADIDYYIINLPRLPIRRTQNPEYRGKTTREILALPDQPNVLSAKTMDTYYTTAKAFIEWASFREGNKGMNTTLLRMTPKSRQRPSEGWQRLTDEQLTLIFESDKSIAYLAKTKHPYQKWIGPLGLHTGARLGELCALRVEDFGTENNTPYMELNDNEGETREGKSNNSVRRIPIHKTLLDLGIMEFVAYKKNDPLNTDQRLFPECTWVKKHGYRKSATRWWGLFLDYLDIKDRKYVFHSFRHNVSDPLTTNDALKDWRICRYFGHGLPPHAPETWKSYFKQKKLEHLLPVIEAINYKIDWTRYKTLTASTYRR